MIEQQSVRSEGRRIKYNIRKYNLTYFCERDVFVFPFRAQTGAWWSHRVQRGGGD